MCVEVYDEKNSEVPSKSDIALDLSLLNEVIGIQNQQITVQSGITID